MARHKDANWLIAETTPGIDGASLAVLMDIRDELKRLNATFECQNAQQIPALLRAIQRNTRRKRILK